MESPDGNGSRVSRYESVPTALSGSLFVLLAAFGFSAKAILIKLAYSEGAVDAISLLALRMAMSLPFFLLVAVWTDRGNSRPAMAPGDWWAILALGMLGYYLASFLDFEGLRYISAGLERLILFLYPTLVVLFSALLARKRVHPAEAGALLLSYAGIALVVVENLGNRSEELWFGVGLVFTSAVFFACYIMGSGYMIPRFGSVRFTSYSMIVACFATGIHFSLHPAARLIGLPLRIYGLAFGMALFSTVLPIFFMNAGIRRLGSGRASIISSAGPVATLILAYFLLGEALSVRQISGTVLVLLGVCVVTQFSSRRAI
ncbi:MAG: DMT family transporter [Gammaproteobacteria bacterium]